MNKGIIFAILAALISGVSVFINGSAVKLVDPAGYTILKNLGALFFLAAVFFFINGFGHFRNLSRKQWTMLVLIGIVGGSLPFLMFFAGLKIGGAAVSSFIFRSLFIFAGVFGYFILKEKPQPKDFAIGLIILLGNALLISGDLVFGIGQLLVLGATLLWALEYTVSRKVLANVDPNVVMTSRMFFGSTILLSYLFLIGSMGEILSVSIEALQWLFITSLMLTGFLFAWYTTLKYLPVFKATAILASGGIVSALLNLVFLGKEIAFIEGSGLILVLLGAVLMAFLAHIIQVFSNITHKLVQWTQ